MQEGGEVGFIVSGPASKHGLTEIKTVKYHFDDDMWTALLNMPFVTFKQSNIDVVKADSLTM